MLKFREEEKEIRLEERNDKQTKHNKRKYEKKLKALKKTELIQESINRKNEDLRFTVHYILE